MASPPKLIGFLKRLGACITRKTALQGDLNSPADENFGKKGEDAAAEYLARKGFKVLERNVRYKTGEIDIIATRGRELHFFEVKTRSDPSLVEPLESVTETKKQRMRRTIKMYLCDSRNNFNHNDLPPCFLNVIGIDMIGSEPRIECVIDAFY